MWLVYFIGLVVVMLVTCYFMEEGVNKAIRYSAGFSCFISAVLLLLLILIPMVINNENNDICKIEKIEMVEYLKIEQDSSGKYFYLRQNYDKVYPEVEIIDSGKTELKNIYYKQKDKFLDDILFDYNKEVLYLNLDELDNKK